MASSFRSSSSNLRNPPPSKKQKVIVTGAEETLDRLSELPESLLIQILSLLPTKDAFTTCILSKRWQYLWTSVYNFKFTHRSFRKPKHFISFVDYVLAHSVTSKIKKFEINCSDMYLVYSLYDCHSLFSRCLSFAVERKVENGVFWSLDADGYKLPESLCKCSSLITLDVKYCSIYCAVISWKYLKSIKLGYSVLRDDDIVNLLSGCPALETMELYMVVGFSRLEINSLNLKRLKLEDYWFTHVGGDPSLEIFAPYLQHLEISGDLYYLKCRFVDVSSVINAKLTFHLKCIKNIPGEEFDEEEEDGCRDYHRLLRTLVQDNLRKLSCATDLTIGTWFTEVLCILQLKGVPIPELKCKYLTLELHMEKFNFKGAAGLLRASPYVEKLNIDMDTSYFDGSQCHFELSYLAKADNVDLQSWISCFVFPNLKNVKIVNSSGVCLKDHIEQGYDQLFKLSEFVLNNATVLEKFIIISKTKKCKRCSMYCISAYFYQLAGKLLGCPRASSNSLIIFQE